MAHARADFRSSPTYWHATPRDEIASEGNLRSLSQMSDDIQFVRMLNSYRSTGGIARDDGLSSLVISRRPRRESDSDSALSELADAINFPWRGRRWYPLFQFDVMSMQPLDAPMEVAAELAPAFSGWSLAVWFAEPNSCLRGRIPADCIRSDAPAVLAAARTDRYIALGL